jgi:hypothetical protein
LVHIKQIFPIFVSIIFEIIRIVNINMSVFFYHKFCIFKSFFLGLTLFFIIAFSNSSCIQTPQSPLETKVSNAAYGDAFILCEGLRGYDNSTLSLYEYQTGKIENDWYTKSNPGLKIGDTAEDITRKGDTAYIAVTTSGVIERFRLSDGQSLGRLELSKGCWPRSIAIINDTTAFVTNLAKSTLIKFNPSTLVFIGEISVGPQPEGIDFYNNYIFTANSAYGDLNWKNQFAETISVIDINSFKEIQKIKAGPNICEVAVNRKNLKLYAAYYNLPSRKDSSGGIIEYDLNTLTQTRQWSTHPRNITLNEKGDYLYFINQHQDGKSSVLSGISAINLITGELTNIIEKPNKADIWYSLNIKNDNTIWIANARNNNVNGEILVYDLANPALKITSFEVGLNPNKIIFYEKN